MKVLRLFLLIFIYLLCFNKAYSQEWIRITPDFDSTAFYNFNESCFINKDTGWASTNISVLKTTNGGLKWKTVYKKVQGLSFSSIKFINNDQGWICVHDRITNKYFMLKTKDGGETWEEIISPILMNLYFQDPLNGFASGELFIYKTTDGGYTWTKCEDIGGYYARTFDINFINTKLAWGVGSSGQATDAGIILKSTNGGDGWQIVQDFTDAIGMKIIFTDSLNGYIAGTNYFTGSVIQKTNDGGSTWESQHLGGYGLTDIAFTSPDTGWAIGYIGQLWKTTNAGKDWNSVETGTHAKLWNIYFFENNNIGYILGDSSVILKYDKLSDVEENPGITSAFRLDQNFPNPFNPSTKIKFQLEKTGNAELTIYDITGQIVKHLLNEIRSAGEHEILWDGKNDWGDVMSSGIYFCKLRNGDKSITIKLTLIK